MNFHFILRSGFWVIECNGFWEVNGMTFESLCLHNANSSRSFLLLNFGLFLRKRRAKERNEKLKRFLYFEGAFCVIIDGWKKKTKLPAKRTSLSSDSHQAIGLSGSMKRKLKCLQNFCVNSILKYLFYESILETVSSCFFLFHWTQNHVLSSASKSQDDAR